MDVRKTNRHRVSALVLLATVWMAFAASGCKKSPEGGAASSSEQDKLARLERRVTAQDKVLAEQDGKIAELEDVVKKVDELQAQLNKREADGEGYDKQAIEKMVEREVKLKVAKASGVPAIGVVDVRRIFQECKRNANYRQEAEQEQGKIIAELEALSREIEDEKARLQTLKIGSDDYLASAKEVLENQAKLQAQQEFYKQRMGLKDQQWTEQLYREILVAASEVAEQQGLPLVLEQDEPELPALSATELMMAIRTHKLLYSGGCVDISNEVLARLDTEGQ